MFFNTYICMNQKTILIICLNNKNNINYEHYKCMLNYTHKKYLEFILILMSNILLIYLNSIYCSLHQILPFLTIIKYLIKIIYQNTKINLKKQFSTFNCILVFELQFYSL